MTDGHEWRDRLAPSLSDFEVMAAEAWERLSPEFRAMCDGLVVRVEEFASDEVLDSLEIESPFDLMGLYHGVSLDQKSVLETPTGPDMVVLYRRAILDYWSEHEERLGHLIAHVLVHEIGHHFGYSDDDMIRIEAEAIAPWPQDDAQ